MPQPLCFSRAEKKLINFLCRCSLESEITTEKALGAIIELDLRKHSNLWSERSQQFLDSIESKLGTVFKDY